MVPSEMLKVAISVNDFIVLPLDIPSQPAFPKETTHYLYLRANAPKVPTSDTSREVFLVNVPTDATETHLRSLFADQLGGARVEHVSFEGTRAGKDITAPVAPVKGKKRKRGLEDAQAPGEEVGKLPKVWDRELKRSGGTAMATFVDKASVELALKEARRAVKGGREIVWPAGLADKVPPLGSARYLAHHRLLYPDPITLQSSVDDFMTAFSAQEAAKSRQQARQRAVPDEEGFITVTRGGRTGPAREEEVRQREEELKKREQNRVKGDFYRFQVREKKKEQARDLVREFEEDRRKVEEMRRRKGRIRPE